MSDVREVDAIHRGWIMERIDGEAMMTSAPSHWDGGEPLEVRTRMPAAAREVGQAIEDGLTEGITSVIDARSSWDGYVSTGNDGPGWIAAIPDAVLMGDAASSMMNTMGWVDREHRVEVSNPGDPSSPVTEQLRSSAILGSTRQLTSWAGLEVRTFDEALRDVQAAFVAGEEEVLARAAASHLRNMGWVVHEQGHMHTWSQHLRPRDFIENKWSCECGAIKVDEEMPIPPLLDSKGQDYLGPGRDRE